MTFFFYTVPSQLNGYDCGLFVCRYAAGLHKIKDELFTFKDIYASQSPLLEKITLNSNFQFDQVVVDEFRLQLGTLVDNLSSVYHHGKLPKRTKRKDSTKKQRATKGKIKKKHNEGKNQSHKQKSSVERMKPESPIILLPEDLHSDTDSVLQLLAADPFLPSPEKIAKAEKAVEKKENDNVEQKVSTSEKMMEININKVVPCPTDNIAKVVPSHENINRVAPSPTTNIETVVTSKNENINLVFPSTTGNINNVVLSPSKNMTKAAPSPTENIKKVAPFPTEEIKKADPSPTENLKKVAQFSTENISKVVPFTNQNVDELVLPNAVDQNAKSDCNNEPSNKVPTSSKLKLKRNASLVKEKSNVRKVLGNSNIEDVKIEADPLIGKPVAFGQNTTIGSFLISQLGEKFDESGVCYDLDSTSGHIVGTVLRINKTPKGKKQVTPNYNVVWEFTAFGESDLALTVLLDGQKEGDKLIAKRTLRQTKRHGRPNRRDASRLKFIKENLRKVSDDEAMHVSNNW
jgi:hypothetical protein